MRSTSPVDDERSHGGPLIHWIADDQCLDAGQERPQPCVPDGLVHVDALNRDATLAGVAETTGRHPLGGGGEVGALVDDDRRVAAEFQHDLLASGAGLHRPADFAEPVKVSRR